MNFNTNAMLLDAAMKGSLSVHSGSTDISQLVAECHDSQGRLLVKPAAFYEQFDHSQIQVFCVKHGYYNLPTEELITFLQEFVGDYPVIEIGAGNGAIGRAMGVTMTDSYVQNAPSYKKAYSAARQATVPYGDDVLHLEALAAVKKFKPHTVLASWVTPKAILNRPDLGGHPYGVDVRKLRKQVKRYVLVGNYKVHESTVRLLGTPDASYFDVGLVQRSTVPDLDVVMVWEDQR